mgnify:CR=1 FL=1
MDYRWEEQSKYLQLILLKLINFFQTVNEDLENAGPTSTASFDYKNQKSL